MDSVDIKYQREKSTPRKKLFNRNTWNRLKRDLEGKNLFLFGAGRTCEEFFLQNHNEYEITAILDNNKERRGSSVHGVPIVLPEELDKYQAERTIVIITSVDHEEVIKAQLEAMGLRNVYSYYEMTINERYSLIGRLRSFFFAYHFGVFSNHSRFYNYVVFHIMAILRILHFPPAYKPYKRLLLYKNKYAGRRCFIVATGPSLRLEDLELLKDNREITFGMNLLFQLYDRTSWRPDFYVIQDPKFLQLYNWDRGEIDTEILCRDTVFLTQMYKGKCSNHGEVQFYPISFLGHLMKHDDKKMIFSDNFIWGIYCAYTVTNVCIQLAQWMGFSEVYLLGTDCNYTQDKKHINKEKDEHKYTEEYARIVYENLIRGYGFIGEHVQKLGTKVYNATRGGQLEVFERVKLEDVLRNKCAASPDTRIHTVEEFLEWCGLFSKLRIYGAGHMAVMATRIMEKNNLNVFEYIVTEKKENSSLFETPIKETEVHSVVFGPDDALLISVKAKAIQNQILNVLNDTNATNILCMNKQLEESIRRAYAEISLGALYNEYEIADDSEPVFLTIRDGNCFSCRIHREISLPLQLEDEFWKKNRLQVLFHEQYGEYKTVYDYEFSSQKCIDDYMYSAFSENDREPGELTDRPEYIRFIHAGAALSDKHFSYYRDDEGDNISEKNLNYSECTVLYWLWKNVKDPVYKGLCHYRRFLKLPFNNLGALLDTPIDIILARPTVSGKTLRNLFTDSYLTQQDWLLMMEGIKLYSKKMYETALKYQVGHFYPPCNIFVMKSEIMDEYCNFAFFVANHIEQYYSRRAINREDRYMGYVFENLLGIFSMHNRKKYNIVYSEMLFVEGRSY